MGFHKSLQALPLHLAATWTTTVGFVTLMFLLLYWILYRSRSNGGRLPPRPSPWPIIGNLHQMRKPVHRALKDLAEKYGPIMFLRLGSVPTVVVSSSEIAKHFLKTHDSIFASRPATAAGKYLSYNFKGIILSPYGDYWRQVRKICVLELFTSKRVESFKHVREEEVSDVGRMQYLQCVVKETLRLYPPAPLSLPHESVDVATVGGYYIPKKTTVMVNVWAIGRDPNVWGEDALDFKPERFMHELSGLDNIMDIVASQSDFRMLPFSAGRRGCPGAAMAIPMIELALAQLLHFFDWRTEGDPSDLDMREESGSSVTKLVPLYAFPKLRRQSF